MLVALSVGRPMGLPMMILGLVMLIFREAMGQGGGKRRQMEPASRQINSHRSESSPA
jgi:hypothetical protein